MVGGINKQIKDHARASNEWKYQSKADKAYSVFETINERLFDKDLPDVIIGFDTRLKKAGEYYDEGDSISLKYHFDMHPDLTDFETVLACLHNAVHAHINTHQLKGKWYHSKLFRTEIAEWGIECNDQGHAIALDPDLITETLTKISQEHLVAEVLDFDPVEDVLPLQDDDPLAVLEPKKPQKVKVEFTAKVGGSKMKKWSCACNPPINVRCAVNLNAQCNNCLEEFEIQ